MHAPKIIAMYLPQFHRIPENDKWWGEGFTEWVSAKSAEPLFEGHYQPHLPQNSNYYDLLKKETMQWQADLMKKYGVDGMCFYHYWFEGGRRILEKPAENLLEWKDINMPFCFCWANETWAKSWTRLKSANVWSEIHEIKDSGEAILLNQNYGNADMWKRHFNYCVPFFNDRRYIKNDNKPIFVLYRPDDMSCLADMVDCWNKLAVESGFDGIYFIGGNCSYDKAKYMDAILYHEPGKSLSLYAGQRYEESYQRVNYDDVWESIISAESAGVKTIYGGFVSYDDTPRRGTNGIIVEGSTPEKFQYYLERLIAKNESAGNNILFINAWNEWGEGMHLEPDEKYGHKYLESIKKARKNYSRHLSQNNNNKNVFQMLQKQKEKYEIYLNTLDNWMLLRENNKLISEYIIKKGYKKIMIYGYGIFGRHLEFELSNSNVEIMGIIDIQKNKIKTNHFVFLPQEDFPDHDIIILTSFAFEYDIINQECMKEEKIISIKNIIDEMITTLVDK